MINVVQKPTSYTTVQQGITITNPTYAYDNSSTTYATINCLTGRLNPTTVLYNFDSISFPTGTIITINSVECKVKCSISDTTHFTQNTIQLYSGSTEKGIATVYDTTATEYTLNTGNSWSESDFNNLSIKVNTLSINNGNSATIRFYDATLTVHYTAEYRVSVESLSGSTEDYTYSITNNTGIVESGESCVVVFSTGYNLQSNSNHGGIELLLDNNNDVTQLLELSNNTNNIYSFTYRINNVTENHTLGVRPVTGYFIKFITYDGDSRPYSTNVPNFTIVPSGNPFTFEVYPNNYSFFFHTVFEDNGNPKSLEEDDTNQKLTYTICDDSNTPTISKVLSNHIIEVAGDNSYNVTTSINSGGTISGGGSYSGGQVTVTITPTNQNSLVTCTDNNTNVTSQLVRNGNDYIYTINNINSHHNVVATISGPYTITTSKTGDGSITPTITNVQHGSTQIITITPQHFNGQDVSLTDNGVTVSANLVVSGSSYTYTLTNITANHDLIATISLRTYTITTSVSGGGTITPTSTVSYGNSKTITITPSSQNSTVQLTDNNVDVSGSLVSSGGSYTYTISSVTTNHTLAATITAYVPPSQTKNDWYIHINREEHPEFVQNHQMVNNFLKIEDNQAHDRDIPHIKINDTWQQAQAVYYKYNGNWLLLWGTPFVPKLLFAADFTSNLSYTNYIDNSTGNFSYTGTPSYTNSMLNIQQGGQNTFRMSFTIPSNLKTWLQDSTKDHWFTAKWYLTNWTGNDGQYRDTFNSGFGSNSNNIYSRDENMFNIFEFNGLYYKDRSDQTGAPYVPAGTTFWIKANLSHEGYYYQYFYASPSWNNSSAGNNNPTANTWYQSSTKTTEIYNINKALWNNNNNPVNLGFASNGGQTSSTARISNFKIWSSEPSDSEIGI